MSVPVASRRQTWGSPVTVSTTLSSSLLTERPRITTAGSHGDALRVVSFGSTSRSATMGPMSATFKR